MDKLFLLDAYALIYRSYYAFMKNPRINSKGLNTSCIMGFCRLFSDQLLFRQSEHNPLYQCQRIAGLLRTEVGAERYLYRSRQPVRLCM